MGISWGVQNYQQRREAKTGHLTWEKEFSAYRNYPPPPPRVQRRRPWATSLLTRFAPSEYAPMCTGQHCQRPVFGDGCQRCLQTMERSSYGPRVYGRGVWVNGVAFSVKCAHSCILGAFGPNMGCYAPNPGPGGGGVHTKFSNIFLPMLASSEKYNITSEKYNTKIGCSITPSQLIYLSGTSDLGDPLYGTKYIVWCPPFWCTSGNLHVSPSAPNQRQCRSPEIHAEKPCRGALCNPKTGLQKQRPLRWTESGVPRGNMQVAVNRPHEAFCPA